MAVAAASCRATATALHVATSCGKYSEKRDAQSHETRAVCDCSTVHLAGPGSYDVLALLLSVEALIVQHSRVSDRSWCLVARDQAALPQQ